MTTIKLALTTDSANVEPRLLKHACLALRSQLRNEVRLNWRVEGSIDWFPIGMPIPTEYWRITVTDNMNDPSALGAHLDDETGVPYAQVLNGPNWSFVASHEMVELMVDPYGTRLVQGNSLIPGQGPVEYLIEPCDPVESQCRKIGPFLVSDFVIPAYYSGDKFPLNQGKYTDAYGHATHPLQLLDGGYLSWRLKNTNHWFQATKIGGRTAFNDLGSIRSTLKPIRLQSAVDKLRQALGIHSNFHVTFKKWGRL